MHTYLILSCNQAGQAYALSATQAETHWQQSTEYGYEFNFRTPQGTRSILAEPKGFMVLYL